MTAARRSPLRFALLALLLAACAPRAAVPMAFSFEARPTDGEVRVLPVLAVHGDPLLRLDGYVGATVSWEREQHRRERTAQLLLVPGAVGQSLPGAVNGALGARWQGRFGVGSWPVGGRERLAAALRWRGDLDRVLGDLARGAGGDAALITWVSAIDGAPLTAEGFPGDIVSTAVGPVMLDVRDEAYRVTARVGAALVSGDGEVVLRYVDSYEAVISSRLGPDRAGLALAKAMAGDLALVWPCDPRLRLAEPLLAHR